MAHQHRGAPLGRRGAGRKALLLGTALVSVGLLGRIVAPAPAAAQALCPQDPPPAPISFLSQNQPIICVNTEPRTGVVAIGLGTVGDDHAISLDNDGRLQSGGTTVSVIGARTVGDRSGVTIENRGDIDGVATFAATGIYVRADGAGSPISITNSGKVTLDGSNAILGMYARTSARIEIRNSGAMSLTTNTSGTVRGIDARGGGDETIVIENSGDIVANGALDGNVRVISAFADSSQGAVEIENSGDLWIPNAGFFANGIIAIGRFGENTLSIVNSGDIRMTASARSSIAIRGALYASENGSIYIQSSGDLWVESPGRALGIDARLRTDGSSVRVVNSGDIRVISKGSYQNQSAVGINAGCISGSFGNCNENSIRVINSGDVWATSEATGYSARGIHAYVFSSATASKTTIEIHNSGNVRATAMSGANALGISAMTNRSESPVFIENSGDVRAEAQGTSVAKGIDAYTVAKHSPIEIKNSGSVFASGGAFNVGISSKSLENNTTTVWNSGKISAESYRAIDVKGAGTAAIFNAGLITGFVDLTEQGDRFVNRSGGVFETKLTSFFGGGNDLFDNKTGGTVLAATDPNKSEKSFFEGLETFKNRGLISMVDGREGDEFTISNTPKGKDLKFEGGGQLAVDAFLGGPGSKSDIFTIEGDVSGVTWVDVNNTNAGLGTFNAEGIRVVNVTGKTPSEENFQLAQPIDTGFFDYDLFFTPTGSGYWDLRSFAGAGAHLLPQLLTAAQDIWHQTSATWLDRTADLRVQFQRGPFPEPLPAAFNGKSLKSLAPLRFPWEPAVWVKGGGSWLERNDTATTRAYGRTYRFDLDRDLVTADVQAGIDFAKRDALWGDDVFVFGFLGGYVYGDLDYDEIARQFEYEGGQVGAYATYIKAGLFIDTLLNVHITEIETSAAGFPNRLDATTVGLRTDTGYRFGSFSGGRFVEPLATIEVIWADIDGFSLGGNRVSFDDDAVVRGRLGLRAGTTREAWGRLVEPFVIGTVWGNLGADNSATLVSTGRTFRFQDDLDDVWGEVSAGVNVFNLNERSFVIGKITTSMFAKVDVTFGDDVSGVGGKAGMRVAW